MRSTAAGESRGTEPQSDFMMSIMSFSVVEAGLIWIWPVKAWASAARIERTEASTTEVEISPRKQSADTKAPIVRLRRQEEMALLSG